MEKAMRRVLTTVLLATLPALGAKFYADDPLVTEPPPRDASKAIARKISDYYDFFQHLFSRQGEYHTPQQVHPAEAVDTLGEPRNGAWYERRHYYRPMTVEELVRGSGDERAPSMEGPWKVVKAKTEGVTPGFEIIDVKGRRYVLKFDPLDHPEIATAPDVLVSKLFHALGYHVPENYIVHFTAEQLEIGEDVQVLDRRLRPRKMSQRDLTEFLMFVPRDADGRFRGGASLYLSGRPVGPYRYFGLRRDDRNDIVPHEHRRDLRGLSVFAAWLGHDDSRAINTLDMLVDGPAGGKYIKHHLIDFGSTLGSASYGANSPRSGFEYLFEWDKAAKQFFTFGLAVPYWAHAYFPLYRGVGRFEADKFDAERWVAEYPNPAFRNRLPDDEFWAAKQVMAFTDDQIAAIVRTGEYSDPRAEKWIVDCLIQRRDKIGRAFLEKVLPLDRLAARDGRLVFEDLGVRYGLAPSRNYVAQWFVFDNDSEQRTAIDEAQSLALPGRTGEGGYLAVDIHGGDARKTVTVYLRGRNGDWEVVGVERRW
jgi:hypothetical protein